MHSYILRYIYRQRVNRDTENEYVDCSLWDIIITAKSKRHLMEIILYNIFHFVDEDYILKYRKKIPDNNKFIDYGWELLANKGTELGYHVLFVTESKLSKPKHNQASVMWEGPASEYTDEWVMIDASGNLL